MICLRRNSTVHQSASIEEKIEEKIEKQQILRFNVKESKSRAQGKCNTVQVKKEENSEHRSRETQLDGIFEKSPKAELGVSATLSKLKRKRTVNREVEKHHWVQSLF